MLTSYHVERKSHTKANHEEILNTSKCQWKRAKNDCFYSTELLEAKTKAVDATATSRSLMLLCYCCCWEVGFRSGGSVSLWRLTHDFCRFSDQLGSIPRCLELFRNRKFSLEKGKSNKVIYTKASFGKEMESWSVSHDRKDRTRTCIMERTSVPHGEMCIVIC